MTQTAKMKRLIQPFIRILGDFRRLPNVPTKQHFPREENLVSSNPQSSNSQSSDSPPQLNHIALLSPSRQVSTPPIQPISPPYWSTVQVDLNQTPVRYTPISFGRIVDQDSSLELEEIRALFLAMLDGCIRVEWFKGQLFTPALGEALALLLHNQRDRFMLGIYGSYDHNHPTVIQHISRNDQRADQNAWKFSRAACWADPQ